MTRSTCLMMHKLLVRLALVVSTMSCSPHQREESSDAPKDRLLVSPPSRGMYLGIAERDSGDMYTFEHALGRRAPLFWPHPVMTQGVEGVIDEDLNFDVDEAQKAWNNGYLVMVSLEPHPENGMRVDDLLRGQYDQHLRRFARQLEQFGKPMFFATAREPNVVLMQWKGGYGAEGDKSLFWALETAGASATASFDPARFPNPQLYEGLGDPDVDDGLERLAAAQRYYHDFFVRREGIDFLTFETMGHAITSDAWDDGEIPSELRVDFVEFYKMLGATADWVSLNFYTLLETSPDPAKALQQNLSALRAQLQAIRSAGINKPILITELGLCATDESRPEMVRAVVQELAAHPEIAGFQLWNIASAHESFADRPCLLDASIGFPELKQAIAKRPADFSSCPRFSDGNDMPTCGTGPSEQLPAIGCLDRCMADGGSEKQCMTRCG